MAVKDLKARWLTASGQELAREAVRRLLTGAELGCLELGEVAGRVDLRGLWLSSTRGLPGQDDPTALWQPLVARRVPLRGIDFSYGTLRIDLDECDVEEVNFDRVGWQGWRAAASDLRRCSFVASDFRDASFDGWNGGLQSSTPVARASHYESCDFKRTRVGAYGGFGRASLDGCTFTETAFPSPMWFRGANLDRCVFRGRFRTVCFGWTGPFEGAPPLLESVDARDATFESLEIYSVTGTGITTSSSQEVVGSGPSATTST